MFLYYLSVFVCIYRQLELFPRQEIEKKNYVGIKLRLVKLGNGNEAAAAEKPVVNAKFAMSFLNKDDKVLMRGCKRDYYVYKSFIL